MHRYVPAAGRGLVAVALLLPVLAPRWYQASAAAAPAAAAIAVADADAAAAAAAAAHAHAHGDTGAAVRGDLPTTIITFEAMKGAPYSVTADEHSLMINGSRSLYLSGSIHYPRSTPQMWDGLLAEAKAGGLTMITLYVFWNLHEPVRGTYDFATGRKNLPLFLQKAADHGLFVYLRPGPYVCAEWDYGGLPVSRTLNTGVRE